MDSKKKSAPFVNIGSSSLIVIFLILCLITFAALSLSSAQSDYRFSQRLAQRKTAYHTASNTAEHVLDSIDQILNQTCQESREAYFTKAREQLDAFTYEEEGTAISLDTDFSSKIPAVSYTVPIDEKQALSVVLELSSSDKVSKGYYLISQWKVISTEKWKGDDTLKLIK